MLSFLLLICVFSIEMGIKRVSALDKSDDPRQNSSLYDILVRQNLKYDSVIGNISQILTLKNPHEKISHITKYKLIYYSPQLQTGQTHRKLNTTGIISESLFSVDVDDGEVHMKAGNQPTLEYLCVKKNYCPCHACIFTLNIIYSLDNKINADSIRVFIDDYNEHPPQFYNKLDDLKISVSELSKIGDSFPLANSTAFDIDAFYNQISYYLVENQIDPVRSTIFDVSHVNQGSPNQEIILTLKAHLDYELNRNYTLFLVAEDNGFPTRLRSFKRLFVEVVDENDNSPVCEKSLFISYVNENEKAEDFLQVKASDLDSGLNGKLKFTISGNSSDLFGVNESNGWLSLKRALDYERKSLFEFSVEVSDSGERNVYKTFCSVRVNLVDLNDNAARIKVIKYLNESVAKKHFAYNALSDSINEIELFENNKVEQSLALLRIFDKDSLSNYRFVIEPDSDERMAAEDLAGFEMRSSERSNREFELVATKALDAEVAQIFKLKIVLYDLNESVKSYNFRKDLAFQVFLYVRVKVLDMNDNGPKFFKEYHEFSIKENTFNVNLSPSIEVFDSDLTESNSKLKFRVSNKYKTLLDAGDYISVDAVNYNFPLLMARKPFDFEVDGAAFEFYLTAYDVDNFTDTITICVRIEDVNDNAPLFMNDNATFRVKENMIASSFVGQVLALDKDSTGPNSDVSFRILTESLDSMLKIYKSGVISNRVIFDREFKNFYSFQIEAFDAGKPAMKTIGTFHIDVQDENDNQPRFVQPSQNLKYLCVKTAGLNESNISMFKIFDVLAEDDDLGKNGEVRYFVEDDLELLRVDELNGSLFIDLGKVSSDERRIIDVRLEARDLGSPIQKSRLNFTLYLNYEMNQVPSEIMRLIDERVEVNTSVNTTAPANLYMIFSNRILVVVMLALVGMIFLSCLVLVVLSKWASRGKEEKKEARRTAGFLGRVKSHLRRRYDLVKLKSACIGQRDNAQDQSLTVKDASACEIKATTTTTSLRNSFRVTVRNLSVTDNNSNNLIFPATILNNEYNNLAKPSIQPLDKLDFNHELRPSFEANKKTGVNSLNNYSMFKQAENDGLIEQKDFQLKNYSYYPTEQSIPVSKNKILSTFDNVYSVRSANFTSANSPNLTSANSPEIKAAMKSHSGLTETGSNSSDILHNLLQKFERFYNDSSAVTNSNVRQQDENHVFSLNG